MRRLVTALAVLVCAALGLLVPAGAPPARATGAPSGPGNPGARDALLAAPKYLARLDALSPAPRAVNAGDQTVTVTGRITNTSDRAIHDVEVRLQEDHALTSESQLRRAVGANPAEVPASRRFTMIAPVLEAGQSLPFSIVEPINTGDGLRLPTPGVYPLVVNVNGRPDYGGQSRVALGSMLLPVLGTKDSPSRPPAGGPAGVSIIWPLVDRPHLLPRQRGKVVLADDDLAAELAPGGRLANLVGAVEQEAAPGSPLSPGLCFAIDPDLVLTVDEMTEGYLVRQGDKLVPGTAAGAAKQWLDRLRGIVQGRCVISLPLADADLVALSQAKLTGLFDTAFTDGESLIRGVLNVQPVDPRVVWPVGGAVDQGTLTELTQGGHTRALLLGAQGLPDDAPHAGPIPLNGGNGAVGLESDPILDATFAGSGVAGQVTGQNVIGALAFRAAFDQGASRAPVLVVPPRQWTASLDELTGVLGLCALLQTESALQPIGLTDIEHLPAQPPAAVGYPEPAAAGALAGPRTLPPAVTTGVAAVSADADNLMGAMSKEDKSQADPASMILPVRETLLRSLSGAWRPDNAAAERGIADARGELDYLRSQVFLAAPGGPLNMASTDSPIPLTIQNNLPVTMNVLVDVAPTPGLKLSGPLLWKIPPNGQRSIRMLGQILRSGRFAVDVSLHSPGGLSLGQKVRLELDSSAYGSTTLIITITAGAALLLLSGRRIFRRIRTARNSEKPAKPAGTRGRPTDGEPKSGDSTEAPGRPPGTSTDQQPAVTAHIKGSDQP